MKGEVFSGSGEVFGEVVFNTSMTGYQEMITDPSYKGQILTLTCPLIGNYGVNQYDVESASPQVEAFLVKEYCHKPRNWRAEESLGSYLDRHGVIGVEGIDTRTLTLHLRRAGTMKGVLSTLNENPDQLKERLANFKFKNARELVGSVSGKNIHPWACPEPNPLFPFGTEGLQKRDYHIVVYDFGIKYNIMRSLSARSCRVTVVPHNTPAADILALKPQGVLLSNGPGDPAELDYILPEIRSLLGRVPLFGICLGHQLLALALGCKTFKLPFGHRGSNHPVKELQTGKVQITSQNHGYCVSLEGGPAGTKATHINLNDNTLEGFENGELKCFSVQYHPEAYPGPRESTYLFDNFMRLIDSSVEEVGPFA